jgi:hypothetical protein
MGRYSPQPLRRLHQLNGPAGNKVTYANGTQISFKFDDIPATMTALGRKHINYVAGIRLEFTGTIKSTGGVTVYQKYLTPGLIQSVQIQGTEIGSPVSSSHMLGGCIDISSYIRNGGTNTTFDVNDLAIGVNTAQAFTRTVDIMLGNFSQKKGYQSCPLALLMKQGEILINTPATLAGVSSQFTDVTFPTLTVTAHAIILPSTELYIANPWQMTRHKATAGSGTDSVSLNSFGANSTLTGVQAKCGVHSALWASNTLVGSSAGPGTVTSITQFAADFLGIRQTNDPRTLVQQLFNEMIDSNVQAFGTIPYIYPFFDLAKGGDIMAAAEVFPVLFPVREFDASKLLDAVGNPSYDLTGTFTPGASHYTMVEGVYPFTMDKLNDLLAVIQRGHLGLELFGTDDLILSTKLADGQDLATVAQNSPEKLTYLPRVVVPRAAPQLAK